MLLNENYSSFIKHFNVTFERNKFDGQNQWTMFIEPFV